MRGAWIEIIILINLKNIAQSLPVRGAWIEIFMAFCASLLITVAPCEGSVD